MNTETVTFDPPGPGGWIRLADHFPAALTAEYRRIYSETCPAGMAMYMERYGVLAKTLDVAYVHGHLYVTPAPLAGPRDFRRTPPTAAVWLLSRVHPEFRKRTRAAERTLAERPWRAVARHWFATERFEWRDKNVHIQDIDPVTLPNAALVEHLGACRAHVAIGYRRHFELHGDDLLPVGLLIARCAEWWLDPTVTMQALGGAAHSFPRAEPEDWTLVTGYDLDNRAWIELGQRPSPRNGDAEPTLDLHPLVPPEHHAELDALLDDARAAEPLRDDNGVLTGAWPMGLLRRAMLTAGERLGFDEPDLAVELTVDELVEAMSGRPDPRISKVTATESVARDRRAERARRSALPAPPSLGPEFAIPPLDALPRPLALIGAAQIAASDNMVGKTGAVGIGNEPYTGRALVVDDAAVALDLLEPGDVVVTTSTSPTWNAVLVHAGALVTSTGGLISHAAVIAREIGLPTVIGETNVCTRFRTGDIVTVDPAFVRVTAATRGRESAGKLG
jgi:rifampicin phosphotransferase